MYLEDDADTYLKDPMSPTTKFIMGTLATVGLAGGGIWAFKSGMLRELMHSTILGVSRYRRGKIIEANNIMRKWSESDGLGGLGKAIKATFRGNLDDAGKHIDDFLEAMNDFGRRLKTGMQEHEERMKSLMDSQLVDKEIEMHRLFKQIGRVEDELREEKVGGRGIRFARRRMESDLLQYTTLDPKKQALMMKQTGFRHATIGDLIAAGEFTKEDEFIQYGLQMYRRMRRDENEFLKHRADANIFIDEKGRIADLRDFRKTTAGFVESLSTDFTIPFIKINPLRMFYVDQMFRPDEMPRYHVSRSAWRNPLVTGHNGSADYTMFYVNGDVYNMTPGKDANGKELTPRLVAQNMFLADAKKGPIVRLTRNLFGISISEFSKPEANAPFWTRARYNIQSVLGLGMQDEPMGQFDPLDLTSYGQAFINKFTRPLQLSKFQIKPDYLRQTIGEDADFFYFRRMKKLEDVGFKEWIAQFAGSRNRPEDVTFASLFPYGFFERLNATLNQVGLGLPNSDLGSAMSIFMNLTMKRVFPLVAGYELFQYFNYESENLTGEQFSDRFAKAYANSSVQLAALRDKLGITDWAKHVTPLFVGGEQIAELPLVGHFFDLNDTKEETEEYWLEGEDPVRKGRWWPLGNTPYTGGKIEYFQPNWVRRVLADVKFSDSQYGSREEYFENSWMPTPRHPFAPIRHFFTDPYHWELKHYQDRPYMVTGGIPELENFPLIGPLLNSTVGAVLKPRRIMHPEYWSGEVQEIAGTQMSQTVDTTTEDVLAAPVTPELASTIGVIRAHDAISKSHESRPVVEVDHESTKAIAAYVTSSGQVQVLSTDHRENIDKARRVLSERSPAFSPDFQQERLTESTSEPEELPVMPASLSQMIGNLHYNVSEMGGFYGFMGTTITGELFDEEPVWQSSHDMTSYSRAFWDLDIGGYGGDANEIFRRFLPKDRRLNEVNPIRNTMPDWMPGQGYFIDFQHGDPYVKIKKGEYRLPGEGYERLYGIDSDKLMRMEIGASFIGYDDETIRKHLLKQDVVKDESFRRKLDFGTAWHKAWEREMAEKGVAISMEQYVKDEKAGIGGFYDLYGHHDRILDWLLANAKEFTYYGPTSPDVGNGDPRFAGYYQPGLKIDLSDPRQVQAYKDFALSTGQYALIDPKTRSPEEWENGEMHFENVQQVNFYARQMKTPINYLIHVDRENPDRGIKVFAFGYNPDMYDYSIQKVENVRNQIRSEIEAGTLSRADLYDPIDRYRILADVAPYSREFRDMKAQLRFMDLDEQEKEEIREINRQVSMRKQRLRLYPYRFTTANLESQTVTVDQVIDNNTFIAKEFPDNPIRLAGLRVPMGKDDPVAQRAGEVISHVIRPGQRIQIAYDEDPLNRIKDDTYHTIQAVVYDRKGRNLNRYLIEEGLAKEKENDYSPAAVHARFTPAEIAFGSLWERFAHLDTFLHTKFLQVRSPLESYERREVYGKDWQEWQDPIKDYFVPAVQNAMTHHPLYAIALGGFIGAAFGSLKPGDLGVDGQRVMARYGKIVGGTIGATAMGAAVMYRILYEHLKGEAWIPERRKKERETEEYFDILKYIKYNALFEKYAQEALKKEKFDVKSYLDQQKMDGEARKQRIKDLEEVKRKLYVSRPGDWSRIQKMLEELNIKATNKEEAMKAINQELASLMTHRELKPIPPIAARAMLYKQATKQTMYGYEPGDPLAGALAALPKKERDYITPFLKAPEEERQRILDIVPSYVRRILQSAWGMPVDPKPDLESYFREHPLPGRNWAGWRENVSIDDIKIKFVDRVGLDPSEFDIWPDDKRRAEQVNVPVPNVFKGRETADSFAEKLRGILQGSGLDGVQVEVVESKREGIHVDLDFEQDRRDEFKRTMNRYGTYAI